MGGSIFWKYWLWWALIASPAVPIVFAWRRVRLDLRARMKIDVIPLALASASSLWMDAAVANWRFLGPLGVGRIHLVLIGGNFFLVMASCLISFFSSISPIARAQRVATGVACLLLCAEWAFLGIVAR
jgi:hypothetical protein